MTFLIILVSLVLERFFHWNQLRHFRWFGAYQRWVSMRVASFPTSVYLLAIVLPPVILVGFINLILNGWLYGTYKFIFGVLVLMYCWGPRNFWLQTYASLNELQKEDPKAAIEQAKENFGLIPTENSQAFHLGLAKAIFVAANTRIFSVLFWFMIFGPMGAVFYRLLSLNAEDPASRAAVIAYKARQILDLIPARIFTFLFALAGNFNTAFASWKKWVRKGAETNEVLLTDCGLAALDIKEGAQLAEDGSLEKETLCLLDRAFMIVLVILALLVLAV